MTITRAALSDLPEILQLQRLAFQSEAELLNDFTIQPLRQTHTEIEREFAETVFFKAVDEAGRIRGSIRGRIEGDTLHIGKLMVYPGCQNQGLGARLMAAIEDAHPHLRCELFTSQDSPRNLYFYEKLGYTEFKRDTCYGEQNIFVFFEKPAREVR